MLSQGKFKYADGVFPRGKERKKLFNYRISVSSQFNEVKKSKMSHFSSTPRELIKKIFPFTQNEKNLLI